MTDNPSQGKQGAIDDMREVFDVFPDEAFIMVAGLHRGFMRMLQTSNNCPVTGEICAKFDKCGCLLEMESWCRDE